MLAISANDDNMHFSPIPVFNKDTTDDSATPVCIGDMMSDSDSEDDIPLTQLVSHCKLGFS